jgi:Polyketide cyclase / dehydrase and lipid transport
MMTLAILVLVGVPCAALIVAHIAGRYLPAEHVATVSAEVAAPLPQVWQRVRAVAAYPSWRKDVKRVEVVAATPGAERFREHSKHNEILYQVEDCAPPDDDGTTARARVVHRIADDSLPFGGRWVLELEGRGAATRVSIREEGVVKSPIFRALGKLFFDPTATMRRYLADLRASLGGA